MRTTIDLDPDVLAAVERLRRDEGVGLSEAVNRLAREGLAPRSPRPPFRQRSVDLGLRTDVRNIGDVLDVLDDADR